MRFRPVRSAVLLLGVLLTACTGDAVVAPTPDGLLPAHDAAPPALIGPAVVISQVYGGGGNSGATLRNDFIELFNRGTTPVDLTGWSVQYTSAAGTSWTNITPLTGTIAPGGYYLVQQAAGAGGTVDLPTPDATGMIAMSATAGKVVLSNQTAALIGACPSGDNVVDRVAFGTNTTSNGCGTEWNGRTPPTSNPSAALRLENGCVWSDNASVDFVIGTPTPRNSASPTTSCGSIVTPEVARVAVAPETSTLAVGGSVTLSANAFAADDTPIAGVSFTWSSSAPTVATVSTTGVVTAVAVGTAQITATTANGTSGTASITVESTTPPPSGGSLVISQVYGGGGNSGATLRNDFIELFNAGDAPVSLTGWSVQYASANGTSWQVTALAGTVQPGGYYLVQQAAGAGGTTDLPTPDAIGGINMSGANGKVLLSSSITAQSGACPTGADVIDRVGFGTTSCASAPGWGNTAVLSNTTAAFRRDDGCVNTGDPAADFVVLAPAPRNSASPVRACTGGGPDRPQSAVTLLINELMGDPVNAESASWGEWFEVYNSGDAPVDLQGFTIVSGGTSQPPHVINRSVIVPARGFAVLGRGADVLRNGGVNLDYNYFVGSATTIWLDDRDYLMLLDDAGARIDSVFWTSLPRGITRALSPGSPRTANVDEAPWKFSTSTFGDGDFGTPGALNSPLSPVAPFVSPNRISVSGRVASDAPLPVGFEAQLFATLRDGANQVVPTNFTWASLTPSIGSVDSRGVIRALSAGLARFRVTAEDGTTRVHSLRFETPLASTTADYRNHVEFGLPIDGDTSDDFLVVRREYVSSFNGTRGTPNWVAYNLNSTHIAPGQDRCNCFTFDPELEAAGFSRYTTADYTGSGAFAGYGIDRGHLVRSFDRTTGSLDNARTYYFSNIVPQAADMNQGPWAQFEIFLDGKARNENREVYIVAGVAGSIGTLKNEGLVTIPEYNWKVALVLPRGAGLNDVTRYDDADVFAVVMPNRPGIRNDPWPTFSVTVDSVESLSGYDLLSSLRDDIEIALESGTAPPVAAEIAPFSVTEWTPVTLTSAGSFDPDGDALTFEWNFGDGATATGTDVSHRYTRDGLYTVRLIAIDPLGLADTTFTTATVRAFAAAEGADLLDRELQAMGADGRLRAQDVWPLRVTVHGVQRQLERGQTRVAELQLRVLLLKLGALERSGRIASADATLLRLLTDRVLVSVRS